MFKTMGMLKGASGMKAKVLHGQGRGKEPLRRRLPMVGGSSAHLLMSLHTLEGST